MKVMTSREFNQDLSLAKRAARLAPVLVTDRGKPTHVLMSIQAFRQMSGDRTTIVDLLAMSEDEIDPLARDAGRDAGPWNDLR